MKIRLSSVLLAVVALVAPLRAAGPYLHGFDVVSLLPPPPALKSAEDTADRDSAFGIYSARTPEDVARGKAEHKVTIFAFAPAIGPFLQPGKFPKLEALFVEAEAEAKKVVDGGKDHWNRPRPFVADPVRFSDPGDPEKNPGYPSGHGTRGMLFALLLSEIFPEQRDAIMAKGALIGWTRVEIGVHTPLDIYAGRVLGQALARSSWPIPPSRRIWRRRRRKWRPDASPTPPMSLRRVACVVALVAQVSAAFAGDVALPARHVVVVVFDGMRPDLVSAETTPNLWKLAGDGVFFAHHHPVYFSSTEVNGTAIATGAYPARSHVIANVDFRPRIDGQNLIGIEVPSTVRRGDEVSGGHYLGMPTVAELLQAHGWPTVIAGSKQVALLHDRSRRPNNPGASPVLYEGATLPPYLELALGQALGDFPPIPDDQDKMERDAWTTRALLGTLWKDGVPHYSLLWLAEPDFSQHATGPGSVQSMAAIRSSDTNLGLVLADLAGRGLRGDTDVMVVSDHGFSTIETKVDVAVELSTAGFVAKRAALGGLRRGEVMVVGEGGGSLLYVGGHDPEVCRRLADFLQIQDWTGVVFSRDGLDGTFPLGEAHIDSPEAPDLVVSLRWTRGKSATGVPGLQVSDLAPTSNKVGNHASLSPYDMHNTLIASGPDFRRGVMDTLPSGNTDLAPTILWILGLKEEAAKMDGRVLSEALAIEAPPLKSYETRRLTARRPTSGGAWEQYLQVSEVNGVRYLDEGNGEFRVRQYP